MKSSVKKLVGADFKINENAVSVERLLFLIIALVFVFIPELAIAAPPSMVADILTSTFVATIVQFITIPVSIGLVLAGIYGAIKGDGGSFWKDMFAAVILWGLGRYYKDIVDLILGMM